MKQLRKTGKHRTRTVSRRDFVYGSAATAAFAIVPRYVLGGPGYTSPSEKLNVGCIGIGGKGRVDVESVSSQNVVALCDVDEQRAAKTIERYPKAKIYRDFRRMLDREKSIDAVTVSTPDHTHAIATMTAIQMGKHVFCQKPLTRTIHEARKITEAARQAKVATQMGNQAHAAEGPRLVCEWIADGAIGPVREVHCWTDRPKWPQGIARPTETVPIPDTLDWDLWLGPAPHRPYHPGYVPFKWRGWWDFGTGALGDMGCHIVDYPFWALKLGHPTSVEACSTKVNSETAPIASIVRYEFPARGDTPPVELTWYDGGLRPARPAELEPGRELPRGSAVLFVGDKGAMVYQHHGGAPRLIPESRMKQYILPGKTLPRSKGHYEEWMEACKGGAPAGSSFDYAGLLTEVVLLGNVATRVGKKLDWDGPKMRITNVPEANDYLHCTYRHGWRSCAELS